MLASAAPRQRRVRRLRLRVDPVACDAFGYCAELLPELVGLDEWGYPVMSDVAIPPALIDLALDAVRACPRRALFVEAFGD
ncbi:MAG TPA: ferredoxin [Acidimicrobiales bacterium]|nr:ferredoxin [Acidimicrobiales bacterium]